MLEATSSSRFSIVQLQCFYKEIIVFILNAISCDATEEELLFSQRSDAKLDCGERREA
jgi:hypothetical protein